VTTLEDINELLAEDPEQWEVVLVALDDRTREELATLAASQLERPDGPQPHSLLAFIQILLSNACWHYSTAVYEHITNFVCALLGSNPPPSIATIGLRVLRLILVREPFVSASTIDVTSKVLLALAEHAPNDMASEAMSILQSFSQFAVARVGIQRRLRSVAAGPTPNTADIHFSEAISSCLVDISGDWYKDPWGWSELGFLQTGSGLRVLDERLHSMHTASAVRIDVAKSQNESRPAVVLDLVDRVCYEAIVDHLIGDRLRQLPDWVYGWRPSRAEAPVSKYGDNGSEWREYTKMLKAYVAEYRFALKADIAQFFASVNIELLLARLASTTKAPSLLLRLESFLRSWNALPRRSGLPQRANASALLAQFYLSDIDRLLSRRCREGSGLSVCRWMDDFWIFGHSERTLSRVRDELESVLALSSLELNAQKSELMVASETAVARYIAATSAVAISLAEHKTEEATVGLNALFDKLLTTPVDAPRNVISFVSSRLRRLKTKPRHMLETSNVEALPQGADLLARLLKDTGSWRGFVPWYVETAHRRFTAVDWAVQAWGLMFPRDADRYAREAVATYFSDEVLQRQMPAMLVPIAAIRTTQWSSEALDALRVAAKLARTPFEMRAVVLAAVQAGAERKQVRDWLNLFPSLVFTRKALEDTSYAISELAPDFR
jgi:hypothetical protein